MEINNHHHQIPPPAATAAEEDTSSSIEELTSKIALQQPEEDSIRIKDKDVDEDNEYSTLSFMGKVIYHAKSLIMEPGFLIYMVASAMGNLMAQDLQLDRACRVNMGYNDTICNALMAT